VVRKPAPLAALLVACGAFFFRYRNAVFPLVFVALVLAFRPVLPAGREGLDPWMDLAGFAVALAGQALRVAVIGFAYVKRGGKHGRVWAARLVTGGFFAHSRNPLYLGNLLILLGLFIIHNSPWVYALGIGFFAFAYRSIVAAEEAYLRERFGEEYAEYCRRAPRWLPDFRGLRRSLEGFRFDWRHVVVKEYGTTWVWIAAALVLVGEEWVLRDGFRPEILARLLGGLAVATAGWTAARWAKKGSLVG
jgi:protein-S-isoprenylcysteine O-methyltransferase Ste14